MKLGIPLFRIAHHRMAAVARHAETLGFESVWVPEHLVFPTRITSPYPYSPDGVPPVRVDSPHLDPLVLLTHIAGATRTIRLGTSIYLLPLRHPLLTARLAMSVDVLSGGRLTLGIGIGWLAEELQAVDVDFRTRAARTRECVRALKVLWTAPEPEFHGRFFSFGPVKFEPKPVQRPHPPLVFGGESEAALRRAAALGDGWYGVGHTPASAGAQVQKLRTALAAAGRADAPFEMTVSHAAAALDRDDLARYVDAGVDRVVVLPSRSRSSAGRVSVPPQNRWPLEGGQNRCPSTPP